jgi:peptidoglycan/xylan/chitin deacetylase (PgdA/CDA1 family)
MEYSAVGCRLLADLFERLGVRSTFFVTGTFARCHPDVVRELASCGHDVGCHGNEHKVLKRLPRDDVYADVKAGKESVEKASRIPVSGFRSPRNMMNPCLYDVLSELSFAYDSSVHPALIPGRLTEVFKRHGIHRVGGIVEVPSSTVFGLPISWWWMRNIGLWYTKLGCEAALMLHGYALLYFHAWEFTDVPHVKGVPEHMTRGTGAQFLRDVESLVVSLRKRGYGFGTIPDVVASRMR